MIGIEPGNNRMGRSPVVATSEIPGPETLLVLDGAGWRDYLYDEPAEPLPDLEVFDEILFRFEGLQRAVAYLMREMERRSDDV